MPADLKPAIWDGPFAAELPDMGRLEPGQEHLVSERDLESSWWKPVKAQDDGLSTLNRDELNQRASELGIDAPEDLPNKQAVIDAIREAIENADGGDS